MNALKFNQITNQITSDTLTQPQILRHCCLMTNGNSHRPDLLAHDFSHNDLICEAMLPEIRTIATLIAAKRHQFYQPSPTQFTDEADWFAARILVLNVHAFHLEISLLPMLQLANQRAAEFAKQHQLSFQAACIRAGLHTRRPANMLLMECHLPTQTHHHWIDNTLAVKQQLCNFIHKKG